MPALASAAEPDRFANCSAVVRNVLSVLSADEK
jgi:hypothetical protein